MLNTDLHIDIDSEPRGYIARSEFSFNPSDWPVREMQRDFDALARSYDARVSQLYVPAMHRRYRAGILVSKQQHCLMELLLRWQQDELHLDIACVISNHPIADDSTLGRTLRRNNVPYYHVPSLGDMDEENNERMRENEQNVLEHVKDTDFLILARFMQILSGDFLTAYGKDVINIHHGLLPSFKGKDPRKQAYDAGVKLIGATAHLVTRELDSGPIIEQLTARVSHRDNLGTFRERSQSIEKQCLALAVEYYVENRVVRYSKGRAAVLKA